MGKKVKCAFCRSWTLEEKVVPVPVTVTIPPQRGQPARTTVHQVPACRWCARKHEKGQL